jgi:RimJ/RimL family protein N-acetyltransferase
VLDAGAYSLRRFEFTDLDLVRRASDDPVIPFVSTVPCPFTEEDGRSYIARQRRRLLDGYGYSFVIADAGGGGVGSIGLWLRDIDQGRAQVGYWVAAAGRRRGAAGNALRAVSRWAMSTLAVARLEIHVEPWNAASVRTAESAGYQLEGLCRSWQEVGGERRDMYAFSLVASDASPSGTTGGA